MKYLFLLGVVSIFSFCGAPEEQKKEAENIKKIDYAPWKTGKFNYRESKFGAFLINRTDSIQEEFIKRTGTIVEFGIYWQNDSMYTLTFRKITENPTNQELPPDIKGLVKECTITNVKAGSYTEKASSNLNKVIHYTTIHRGR